MAFKMNHTNGSFPFKQNEEYAPQTNNPKEEITPQTEKPKEEITPQTQYPKVGDTLKVTDYAGPGMSAVGKILKDDKHGSYEFDSEKQVWTKISDTGGIRTNVSSKESEIKENDLSDFEGFMGEPSEEVASQAVKNKA